MDTLFSNTLYINQKWIFKCRETFFFFFLKSLEVWLSPRSLWTISALMIKCTGVGLQSCVNMLPTAFLAGTPLSGLQFGNSASPSDHNKIKQEDFFGVLSDWVFPKQKLQMQPDYKVLVNSQVLTRKAERMTLSENLPEGIVEKQPFWDIFGVAVASDTDKTQSFYYY